MPTRAMHAFPSPLLLAACVALASGVAVAEPPEDLAAVLKAYDLRLLDISARRISVDPYQHDTTVARAVVQSRAKALTRAKAQEATERIRRAFERIGCRRLVACDVLFYDSTRDGRRSANYFSIDLDYLMMGSPSPFAPSIPGVPPGDAYAKTLSTEVGMRLDKPVAYYARSIAYRPYEGRRPSGAPKSVKGTVLNIGAWRRTDYWAQGNTAPPQPGATTRVLPVTVAAEVGVLDPDSPPLESEPFVAYLDTGRDQPFKAEADYGGNAGASCVFLTTTKPLGVSEMRVRTAALRTVLEDCDLEGLCAVAAEFARPERFTYRSQGVRPPLELRGGLASVKPRATATYDLRPLDQVVKPSQPVEWYGLVVEYRPLRFAAVPLGPKGGDEFVLRLTKAEKWASVAWTAEGNAAAPTDATNVTLFPAVRAK